jgi:hypothetical protein
MYMMSELAKMFEFLPSLVVCPSLVTHVVMRPEIMRSIAWDKLYPVANTVFINLAENIEAELKTEGTQYLRPTMGARFQRQEQQVSVSKHLGQLGYRAKTISDFGSSMDIAHLILDEIRLTQRNVLELERGRQHDES